MPSQPTLSVYAIWNMRQGRQKECAGRHLGVCIYKGKPSPSVGSRALHLAAPLSSPLCCCHPYAPEATRSELLHTATDCTHPVTSGTEAEAEAGAPGSGTAAQPADGPPCSCVAPKPCAVWMTDSGFFRSWFHTCSAPSLPPETTSPCEMKRAQSVDKAGALQGREGLGLSACKGGRVKQVA